METAQAIFKMGEDLFVDRKFKEAEKYFLQAIAIKPDTLWLIYLGETYAYLAQWQSMEDAYNKAIQLEGTTEIFNTDLAWCYFGRGRSKNIQHKYQSAIEDFEQALKVGGDAFINGPGGAGYAPTDIYLFEARAYEALNDYRNAIKCYQLFVAYTGKHYAVESDIDRLEKLVD